MNVATAGSPELLRTLARVQSRRRLVALMLTLPLLVFLLVTFLVPIGALLIRAVENPEVVTALPRSTALLGSWDRKTEPPAAAYAAVAEDLSNLGRAADAGALARRLNTEAPGARSLIMDTYRATQDDLRVAQLAPDQVRERMLALDERWGDLRYWRAIAKNASKAEGLSVEVTDCQERLALDPGLPAYVD